MRFEQHFPSDIDNDKGEDRLAAFQLLQCLLGGLLRRILTRDTATDEEISIHPIAYGSIHAETTVCFHADWRADDQLISLLHTERIQPRQMTEWRKRPF